MMHADLNWDDLRYFLALARTGTLRGSAALMRANHVTVSRRLNLLEEQVEGRLFDRGKSGFTLTPLGEELLPHAERIEEEFAGLSRAIVGRDTQPSGTIYLSIPHALTMTSIMDDLVSFSDLYPDIQLDITTSNDIADLNRREADVSIRVADKVMDDVVGRKLVQMSSAAYCSPDYAAAMEDNGGEGLHYLGMYEADDLTTADWITNSHYPKAKLRHRIREIVPQLTLAAAGMGLAQVACCLGDRHPGLIRAPYQKPVPHRYLWLLLHQDLRRTARVRLFVDFLSDQVRKRKSEFWAGMD